MYHYKTKDKNTWKKFLIQTNLPSISAFINEILNTILMSHSHYDLKGNFLVLNSYLLLFFPLKLTISISNHD